MNHSKYMKSEVKDNLLLFSNQKPLLINYQLGLEREALRVTEQGQLATTPHPKSFGAKLTHPFITTDFAEAQLEYATPPLSSHKKAQNYLMTLHQLTQFNLNGELLWPSSMPCILPSNIQIAEYGTSSIGRNQEIYRRGLTYRYGTNMQMISGIHYNFSFTDSFWKYLHRKVGCQLPLQDFISDSYLKITRAFLCEGWILTYLFGASPLLHTSYLAKHPSLSFLDKETLYGKYATSLRMSSIGYYSRVQERLTISYDDLKSYIQDLKHAISTPNEKYKHFGNKHCRHPKQLSTSTLQIENEYYSWIRPKRMPKQHETSLQALEARGIEYLEIRSLDINPYHPLGINIEQMQFLHVFIIYCLFKKENSLESSQRKELINYQEQIALFGRDPKFHQVRTCGLKILDDMKPIAAFLGKTLKTEQAMLVNPNLTPSAKILNDLQSSGKSYQSFFLNLAKKHQESYLNPPISPNKLKAFESVAQQSIQTEQLLDLQCSFILEEYKDLELSTQIIIHEAIRRNIKVEVLDWQQNFIRLTQGETIEYLKEATKTSRDSYISAHIMGNKQITKQILSEHGLQVPLGESYQSIADLTVDYHKFAKIKTVIKPNCTNFGIGVDFSEPGDKKQFFSCVRHAFKQDTTILIEEFHPGKEYRFLIIGNKIIGVLKREPVNIIGDGQHTIKQLIKIKNNCPKGYTSLKNSIQLTKIEKAVMKQQNLSSTTILKKGEMIYLRHNSNTSTGGDPIDVTDEIHTDYKQLALKTTQIIGVNICGVDLIITDLKQPAHSSNYCILEMNFNPMLSIHSYPYRGKARNTGKAVLDFLGFL